MADDTRYAYAVARVRGMETRLLDRQWIERLLGDSADGALKTLSDSAYQDAVSEVTRPEDLEPGLEASLAETLSTVSQISPEPALVELFRVRWDFRNTKSLLKAALLKLEAGPVGTVDGTGLVSLTLLEKAVQERDYAKLPSVIADAARRAEETYRDRAELADIDFIFDAAMWEHSIAVAAEHGNDFLVEYFRTEIDLANIKAFVRIKEAGREAGELSRALIPGGFVEPSLLEGAHGEPIDTLARALEYGRYPAIAAVLREWSADGIRGLELAADNELLRLTEVAKTVAYGVEPLIRYILIRQIETKLIRTAVTAKLDGLPRGDVEARLRTVHV
jgi:V/A-type H+-transporting ATPase subunit C